MKSELQPHGCPWGVLGTMPADFHQLGHPRSRAQPLQSSFLSGYHFMMGETFRILRVADL